MMTATHAKEQKVGAKSALPGILIADDEPAIRQLLQMGLEAHGFQVWLAASGAEAVELYQRHGAAIAIVLLDVLMPEMDGPQTLQALEQLEPDICCVFMSGSLGTYTEPELLRRGARGLVSKPFVLKDLADRLRQLVETR